MLYQSLMAGRSRGFTLMMRAGTETEAPAGTGGSGTDRAEAGRSDLIAALRFPLAPGWILQAGGEPSARRRRT